MSELGKQDWHDWLQHPVTQAFVRHVDAEWGAGGKRFEGMFLKIADQLGDPAQNMAHLQQICIARREIQVLMKWPHEEMQRLRSLDREPVGQSRRGTL